MKKLIGFEFQSGEFTNKDSGEVIEWGNILCRIATDEDLKPTEYGLNIAEVKVKAVNIASSVGVNNFEFTTAKTTELVNALQKILNKNIDFTLSLVKGSYTITGIKILS
mgnify:CR=1 FL=1